MRVSTYFAATLPEAMGKVRDALGPDAIVLSWRNARGGIEISASIQGESIQGESIQGEGVRIGTPRAAPKLNTETLGQHFSHTDFHTATPSSRGPKKADQKAPDRPLQRGLGALVGRHQGTSQTNRTLPPTRIQPAQAPQAQTARETNNEVLIPFLLRAGLSGDEALQFAASRNKDLRRALIETLDSALSFKPIEAIPAKPVVLVGPAGAGKSACAAKLAARTLAAGHEVLLISADAERCGGADQLEALAKRLGTRFTTVTTLVDLNHFVIKARQRGMVVYVDAPAASPTQPADLRATQRLIEETRLEPILCLPADLRPDDMSDLACAYREIGVARAIITRLDLTKRRASALHALATAHITLSQISATPYISGGVAMASAQRLAGLLLEPFEDALENESAGQAA